MTHLLSRTRTRRWPSLVLTRRFAMGLKVTAAPTPVNPFTLPSHDHLRILTYGLVLNQAPNKKPRHD